MLLYTKSTLVMTLSDEQSLTLEYAKEGHNIFITGGGGVGKSFIVKTIVQTLREKKKNVYVTSSTGVAAINVGGVTLHSLFGCGLAKQNEQSLFATLRKNNVAVKAWTTMNVLVIDEVSLLDPCFFEKCSNTIAKLRKDARPFGGIQVIIVGDFAQLPPVKESSDTMKEDFCFETKTWKDLKLKTIQLQKNFRQKDATFVELLQRMRFQNNTEDDYKILRQCLDRKSFNRKEFIPTVLYARNESVDSYNEKELEKLKGEEKIYTYSIGRNVVKDFTVDPPMELLLKKHESSLLKNAAPNVLKLKVGAQVLLLANLSFEDELINGSRGVVVDFEKSEPYYPIVKFVCGVVRTIGVKEWTIEEYGVATISYYQLPLKLAWSITIHKAQGLTLDCVQLSTKNIFTEGQAYVAFSRVRNEQSLFLVDFHTSSIRVHPKVKEFYNKNCSWDTQEDILPSFVTLKRKIQ